MPQITILCGGSRGDTQPYIALGAGLKSAGYHVRIATDGEFEPMAVAHGLEFFSTEIDSRVFIKKHIVALIGERNPLKIIRRIWTVQPLLKAAWERQLRIQWQACQGSTAIAGHMLLTPFGLSLAEKLGIPYIEVDGKPVAPTRAYPSIMLPPFRLGGAFNLFTHHLFEKVIWQVHRSSTNRWRKQTLMLPSVPIWRYHRHLEESLTLRLCGVSPHVIPRPPDWAEHIHMTGYWTLKRATTYQPPARLAGFLAAGPAPIYIGFGSMPSPDPQATTRLVVKALALAGQRGVLLGGWDGLADSELPDSVCYLDSAPHGWLFPRMAAVVHHGGAGTAAAGLRAGVPSIVVPLLGDQTFWGHRIHDLGVGPKPLSRRKLTPERLAGAIQVALTDQDMRDRAAALGEKLRAEDGIANAVEIINHHLAKG